MIVGVLVLGALASTTLGAKCPGFPTVECKEPNGCWKDRKDWKLQALPVTGYVVFEISVPQFTRQRTKEVVIGLFGSIVPNATLNFATFASFGVQAGPTLYRYQGTPFHRIVKNRFLTGGDVFFKNGTGTFTYQGKWSQPADNWFISNYGKGWVGMEGNSDTSIGSTFFITLTNDRKVLHEHNKKPILHLGKVLKGWGLIKRINSKADRTSGRGSIPLDKTVSKTLGVSLNRPKQDILITKSSFLTLEEGAKKGYPNYAFNRPTEGCLTGRWPK